MIRIVIIVVVAIALLIGGVFGLATFAPNLLPNMVLELLGIEPPKEKTITQPVRPGPLETILIDLEPMEIPLFRDNKVDRKLFMHILIEVRRGKDEKIIEGNPDKIKFVTDSWKFTKNINNKSPNWYLSEIISQ